MLEPSFYAFPSWHPLTTLLRGKLTVGNLHFLCFFHIIKERVTTLHKKNVVFWDVELCRSCVNGRCGRMYRLHHQGRKIRERRTSVSRRLKMEVIRSSATSVNASCTQRHIPEDDILHSHCCESLNSYILYITLAQCKGSTLPITVAARSMAWTVFACSEAGIVGSNPTQGMDVCVRVYSVFVLSCV
jgi:hypothetical protein